MDLHAAQAQGMRLMTTFLASTDERKRTFSEGVCRHMHNTHLRHP